MSERTSCHFPTRSIWSLPGCAEQTLLVKLQGFILSSLKLWKFGVTTWKTMGFCIGLSDTWQLSFQQPVSEPLVRSCFWCRREDVRMWPRSKLMSLFQAFAGNETQNEDMCPGPCSLLRPSCSAEMNLIYRLRWSHNPWLIYRLQGVFAPNSEPYLLLCRRGIHKILV